MVSNPINSITAPISIQMSESEENIAKAVFPALFSGMFCWTYLIKNIFFIYHHRIKSVGLSSGELYGIWIMEKVSSTNSIFHPTI